MWQKERCTVFCAALSLYWQISSADPLRSGLPARAAWQQNPEDIVIGEESAKNIERKLFSRLSKMERQVLDLFLQGQTYQEIAEELGKSPKAIDNALQRIKGKLAKMQKKV